MKKIALTLMLMLFATIAYADEIDDILIHLIQVESGGNSNAVSQSGCVGLCQLNPNGAVKEFVEWNNKEYETDMKIGYAQFNDKSMPYIFWSDRNPVIEQGIPIQTNRQVMLNVDSANKFIATWYLRRLRDHYLKDISGSVSPDGKKVFIFTGGLTPSTNFQNDYKLITKEDTKLALILAAYNMGPTALKKINYDLNKAPKETRAYVKKIMLLKKQAEGKK